MTTRGRTARRPVARSRPRYTWRYFHSLNQAVTAGAQLNVQLNTNGTYPTMSSGLGVFGDYTIRRIVGDIMGVSADATNSNETLLFAFGVYVGEHDAVVALAFPELQSDPADYMMFGNLMVPNTAMAGATGDNSSGQVHFDNHSMRRVNENHQDVVLLIQADASNADTASITVAGRYLVSHGQR